LPPPLYKKGCAHALLHRAEEEAIGMSDDIAALDAFPVQGADEIEMGHNDDIPPPDDDAVVESSEDLPHHPHHHHHPSSGGASTDDGGVEEDTTADGAFCVLFRCLYCGSRSRLVHVNRAFTQYPCRFTLCLPLTKP
jgi:hypothetical protein